MNIYNIKIEKNIFYQSNFSTGVFVNNPTNITLLTFSIILVLILVVVIIWRVFINKTKLNTKNNKNIGSIDKEFKDFLMTISTKKNVKILYNILIKNKFAKMKYSIIPAIIFVDNKCYIISNLVKNNPKNEIVISKKDLNIVEKGTNQLIHENVKLNWYNEILKYINNISDNKNFAKKVIILKNSAKKIVNETDFIITNIFNIEETLEQKESAKLTDFEINKVIKKLTKENQWKIKNKALK